MNIEIIASREALVPVVPRWNELAAYDRRDGFFRSPAWYMAWIDRVRPEAKPHVAIARDSSGEIVGLAPLCHVPYRDLGFPLSALSFGGREVVSGDYLDFVCVPERRPQVVPAILEHIWNARSDWDLFIAGEVEVNGDTYRAAADFAERTRAPFRVQEERTCPFIELPGTFDDYLRTVSQQMRYKIRRDTRDLIEKFRAAIDVYTGPEDLRTNMPVLVALHQAHWNRVNQPGNLGRPGFVDFLVQVAMAPPPGATVRLSIASHNGVPAAAHLAFWYGDSALFYQSGWDPDSAVARVSPGMVLQGRSIRDALEHGLRYYDFLRGDETYKTRLTKTARTTATILLAKSFLGREYLRVARLKDSVKRIIGPELAGTVASSGQAAR